MYTVVFTRAAEKALAALSSVDRARVRAAIMALADEPYPSNAIQMSGSTLWRLRVGKYRVVYDVDETELIVTIIDAGHRRDIYR